MLSPNSGLAQYNSMRRVSWVTATPIRPMFPPGPRRRDAGGRDPGGQPGPAQGLRHRHLLGRGDRVVCRTGSVFRESRKIPPQPVNGKNGNYGGPKVRDRLSQLIRQYKLDAA